MANWLTWPTFEKNSSKSLGLMFLASCMQKAVLASLSSGVISSAGFSSLLWERIQFHCQHYLLQRGNGKVLKRMSYKYLSKRCSKGLLLPSLPSNSSFFWRLDGLGLWLALFCLSRLDLWSLLRENVHFHVYFRVTGKQKLLFKNNQKHKTWQRWQIFGN